MSKAIEEKKKLVEQIVERLKESKSTVITDYKGLNVTQMTELRKQLREAGVEYKVLKNTLMRFATEELELSDLHKHFVGPTAVAFSNDDVVAPAKILHNFAKENEQLEIKAGIVEGRIADLNELEELAKLPSYDGLVSMLLSVLQGPVRNLAYVLQAVAEQKEEQEA